MRNDTKYKISVNRLPFHFSAIVLWIKGYIGLIIEKLNKSRMPVTVRTGTTMHLDAQTHILNYRIIITNVLWCKLI